MANKDDYENTIRMLEFKADIQDGNARQALRQDDERLAMEHADLAYEFRQAAKVLRGQ